MLSIALLFVISILLNTFSNQQKQSLSLGSQQDNTSLFTGSKKGIAVIELYGPIAFSDTSTVLFPSGADLILKQIKLIKEDKNVKGILIKINSPGGTVGASQEIYQALLNCKEDLNIPIVAQIGDVGASGGYYIALAADKIFANAGSLVGSIGVILGNINVRELANDNGVYAQVYTGGKYKDQLSMWRDPTAEEKDLLGNLVDNVHGQFKKALQENRAISDSDLEKVAEGQIFTGSLAQEVNLIDNIGSFQDAISYIGSETGLGDDPHIISKSKNAFYDVASILSMSIQNIFFKTQTEQLKVFY